MNDDPIAASFDQQAEACDALGSPIYHKLIAGAADDIRAGGRVAGIVEGFADEPVSSALALRLMGGVHRLVLMGLAPQLALHYPSAGGTPNLDTIVETFDEVVRGHPGYLRDALSIAPQTNDPGRCVALLPALGAALEGRSHAVRLFEIGSAGGLNLLLDQYRYEADGWSWGPSASPVTIRSEWRGAPPALPPRVRIVERRGCDVAPIDVTDREAALRLMSFIWPDHLERFARARGAIEVARAAPPRVDTADAAAWIADRLAEPPPRGTMTVVQHSVMWQYLPDDTKARIETTLRAAGERASKSRPLAHIAYEPARAWRAGKGFAVRVVVWPGGNDRIVGRGHPHGAWIDWMG